MGGRRISEGETVKTLDALADALGSGMSLLGYLDNRAASRLIDSAVRREMASALRRGASLSDAVDAWANLSTAEASLLRAAS